ncbi:MAG: hypothetical protein GY762_21965 [Proteobacteria bacterium]|nr:hypothetical protein [Pseudomonadota bacterium]
MKLWSRGLGKTEIDMDLRYYKIVEDAETGGLTMIGNMQSPVTWEFTIKLEPDDIAGVIKLALNVPLLKFAAKNLYRYPLYLKNRKDFVLEDDEHLEERVMAVYKKMTTPNPDRKKRGGKKRNATKSSEKAPTTDRPKVVAQPMASSGA